MIFTAVSQEIEQSVNLTVHDCRRKRSAMIQTGVFPQNPARDGEQGIIRIAVPARGVCVAVTSSCNSLHRLAVELPVRIGKMIDGYSQLRFQLQARLF